VVGHLLTGDPVLRAAALELGDFALVRRARDADEADPRALANYLRSLVTLCELTGEARFCRGADGVVPTVAALATQEELMWSHGMLGKAIGRWLELDDTRALTGQPSADRKTRTLARTALLELCRRIAASPLPLDINRVRFADVLAYGAWYSGSDGTAGAWLEAARRLVKEFEAQYWATGTYSNAKEMAILLSSGGVARSAGDPPLEAAVSPP